MVFLLVILNQITNRILPSIIKNLTKIDPYKNIYLNNLNLNQNKKIIYF